MQELSSKRGLRAHAEEVSVMKGIFGSTTTDETKRGNFWAVRTTCRCHENDDFGHPNACHQPAGGFSVAQSSSPGLQQRQAVDSF